MALITATHTGTGCFPSCLDCVERKMKLDRTSKHKSCRAVRRDVVIEWIFPASSGRVPLLCVVMSLEGLKENCALGFCSEDVAKGTQQLSVELHSSPARPNAKKLRKGEGHRINSPDNLFL